LVHDIGKTLIPTEILNKKGKLTEEEFDIVKMHPSNGSNVLGNMEQLCDIAKIVRSHHERWDG